MIPWINVNGTWKQPSAIWGKANGVWESKDTIFSKKNGVWTPISLKREAFNEALALVGLDKVDNLSVLLASSEMCTALAGNADAYTIMKDNYTAEMTTAIDSAWNEGLNLLNYKAKLPCYIYRHGNECTDITGGYDRAVYHCSSASDAPSGNNGSYIYAHAKWLGVGSSYLTKNAINTSGYTKAQAYGRTYNEASSQCVICGIAHKGSDGNDLTASMKKFPFPTGNASWSTQTTTSFGTNGYWGVYVRAVGGNDEETGSAEAQYIKLLP